MCICACVFQENRDAVSAPPCMQIDMCQSLQVAEAAGDPSVVLCLEAHSLPNTKQKSPLLPSCSLDANFENKDTEF